MRRSRVLLVMALLVGALALALTALSASPQEAAPSAPQAPGAAYRMLYERPQQDFDRMTVTLSSGESYAVESSMGFDAAGNLLGVYNSLGQPVTVQGQSGFALSRTSWQMMLLTATNLPVTATYPALDPAACGLDAPSARIEIAYRTGDDIVLTIGKPAASGFSCYVQMQGDSSVHLAPLDFYQVMTQPLKNHHSLPGAVSSPASSAVQAAVVRPGQENFIVTNYGTESRILPWQVDSPFLHAGSTERIQAFVETVSAIHADAYETTVSAAAQLAAYGLDEPTRLLVAFQDGTIRDIHLGADAGDGTVYARMDGTGDVYRIGTSQLPALDSSGTDALLDRFLALVATNEVSAAAIRTGGAEYLLTITPEDDGNRYTLNDQALPGDVFAPLYTSIVGMQFDKTTDETPVGDMLCEVRFLRTDGSVISVAYYEHDRHSLHAKTSGGGHFLIRRERLDSMLDLLKEALP